MYISSLDTTGLDGCCLIAVTHLKLMKCLVCISDQHKISFVSWNGSTSQCQILQRAPLDKVALLRRGMSCCTTVLWAHLCTLLAFCKHYPRLDGLQVAELSCDSLLVSSGSLGVFGGHRKASEVVELSKLAS